MPRSVRKWSFVAGVLVANSGPHLAVAVAGRRHLTPLAGRNSSPAVNAVWGAANLVGGLLLLRRTSGSPSSPPAVWNDSYHWFGTGAAVFAAWMAVSERVLRVNTPVDVESGSPRSCRG